MWLDRVGQRYGERLQVTWKSFSLDQVNQRNGSDRKLWEQPEERHGRSLLALRAGEAARRQGRELFERFHLALLYARHGGDGRIALNELGQIIPVAAGSGLDVARLHDDVEDPGTLAAVARDHTEAVERYGVFGTPTFVFENGQSAYLKAFIPPEEDSVPFFEHFVGVAAERSYVGEIKRPQPPWPKGAVR